MPTVSPVDLVQLEALFNALRGRVKYRLGAKARSLSALPKEITHLDCSGMVRWLLAKAGGPILPDGSWYQNEWCKKNLRKLARYSDVDYAAADPGRLFVAFLPAGAIRRNAAGHIWLIREGRTLESYGSVGVGSRPWSVPVLLEHASAAYEVPVLK